MTAQVDPTVGYYGWALDVTEPEESETPYKSGSMENAFWPTYRLLYQMIKIHADAKDSESLRWHKSCLRSIMQEINKRIIEIDKAGDNV